MKILNVTGDDYAALHFANKHGGTAVIDIINSIEEYAAKDEEEDDGWWELSVDEVEGEVSKSFIDYVKTKIDYDDSKHTMWYHETETI
jgi:hypothetical protein